MRAVKTEAVLLVCLRPTACSVLWLMGDVGMCPGASKLDYSLQGTEHRQERLQESKDPTRSKDPPTQDRVDCNAEGRQMGSVPNSPRIGAGLLQVASVHREGGSWDKFQKQS